MRIGACRGIRKIPTKINMIFDETKNVAKDRTPYFKSNVNAGGLQSIIN